MNIGYYSPSYKRSTGLITAKWLHNVITIIAENEYQGYIKNNPECKFIKCSDKAQGNVARIRNWILDNFLSEHDWLVILDDDVKHISIWEENENVVLTEKEVYVFMEKYSRVAEEWGIKFWGININPDKQGYKEQMPFSCKQFIGGPAQAFSKDFGLRYDERFTLKEDYDLTIQALNRYRRILRVNKAHYVCKQVIQAGGCASDRSLKKEKEQMKLLQKKWGTKMIKEMSRGHIAKNRKKTKNYQINPIINVPIKGI